MAAGELHAQRLEGGINDHRPRGSRPQVELQTSHRQRAAPRDRLGQHQLDRRSRQHRAGIVLHRRRSVPAGAVDQPAARTDEETLKDTFVNIRDTNEFVVNIATIGQADAVHRSAYEFGTHVDEFEALGLEKAPSEIISAPRIAGAPISFECVVDRIIPMPPLPDHVVWGRVQRIHIRDDLYLPNGRIDVGALGAFGRLAAEYTLVDNIFTTPLPDDLVEALGSQRAAGSTGAPPTTRPSTRPNGHPRARLKEERNDLPARGFPSPGPGRTWPAHPQFC